ncbi:DUF1553 domain-containing protein [Tunicatimonas pelagia]|uniref:DUF1553 domain-containing protein n=1 Tax=Tunicatimonas pelagia TaxID=931531 RepID=UPI002667111E|nr:DUF1553 domain-containing protein [Tunicatimonas pelagia]WKN41214.1 DUF1549 domain-containing protein [Tunicatimonas pelagia]
MNSKSWFIGLGVTSLVAVMFFTLQDTNEPISYNQHIRPIINSKCISCHGGVKKSAGVSFLFREEALDTAESGIPAIVPGDAESSGMYQRIVHHDPEYRMPSDGEPLNEAEIELISQWINEGAQWEDHWAYISPDTSISPPKAEIGNLKNDVDYFIYNKLEAHNLTPAAEAGKEILLRRLYLDLTGLPPTPEEAQVFLADSSSDAYEKLVDHLLDSPHFGERWAAMWLDLARYADTKGYEKDLDRSIWKYRDWVINAFNQDMPYDQFTIEQLAGDLLPNPTKDQLIATAFHRNTMANDEGGTDNEEFRVAAVVERVGTTFEVWQGTTMACVQCHSHPYDPFRHQEFYQFMAFFNNTVDRDIYNEQPKLFTYEGEDAIKVQSTLTWLKDHLDNVDTPPNQSTQFLHQQKESLLHHLGYRKVEAEEYHASSKLIELLVPYQDVVWQIQDSSWIMFEDVDLSEVEKISFRCATALSGGFIEARLDSVNGEKLGQAEITTTGKWNRWAMTKPEPDKWREFTVSVKPRVGTRNVYYLFRKNQDLAQHLFHLDWIYYHERNPRKKQYSEEFNQRLVYLSSIQPEETPIMQDLPRNKSRKTYVFERGNWTTQGQLVSADVPEILGEIPDGLLNNRLGMAQWLVSKDNPLTARVAVNHFWKEIFGTGIIETSEEFGSQGASPSHPELLDWLAVQLVNEYRWSIKSLLKLIVTSATYRQSSQATDKKIEKDPLNRLLSRGTRVRLSAEQIRDQVLAVTNLLNRKVLGPSIKVARPDANRGIWSNWIADTTSEQYRRSLYIFTKRISPHPMLTTFDGTARNVCISRRIRTNTPLQALTLLNDSTLYAAAKQLAELMTEDNPTDVTTALVRGYERVILRKPDDKKVAVLIALYQDALAHYTSEGLIQNVVGTELEPINLHALTLVANAMLNLDEFITKN